MRPYEALGKGRSTETPAFGAREESGKGKGTRGMRERKISSHEGEIRILDPAEKAGMPPGGKISIWETWLALRGKKGLWRS